MDVLVDDAGRGESGEIDGLPLLAGAGKVAREIDTGGGEADGDFLLLARDPLGGPPLEQFAAQPSSSSVMSVNGSSGSCLFNGHHPIWTWPWKCLDDGKRLLRPMTPGDYNW